MAVARFNLGMVVVVDDVAGVGVIEGCICDTEV